MHRLLPVQLLPRRRGARYQLQRAAPGAGAATSPTLCRFREGFGQDGREAPWNGWGDRTAAALACRACHELPAPPLCPSPRWQVHIWLFCIAIFHVACSVLQFLLGQVRVRLWRRWERRALEQEAGGAAAASGEAANGAGAAPPAAAAKDEEAAAGAGAAEGPEASKGSMVGGAAEVLKEQAVQLRGFWRFRQASMHRQHGGHWLAEALVCLFQALWPNLGEALCEARRRSQCVCSQLLPPAAASACLHAALPRLPS